MHRYETARRIPHTPDQLFALIADVEQYPHFVPLCERLVVRSREAHGRLEILTADMTVAYKFLRETFTSRVALDPEARTITVNYLDGPFSHMENLWRFVPAGSDATDVRFSIAYAFRSRMLELLMGAMFDRAVRKFTAAFEARADQLYGRRPASEQRA
jgi:coenzyme Q-binding protein COQ10